MVKRSIIGVTEIWAEAFPEDLKQYDFVSNHFTHVKSSRNVAVHILCILNTLLNT